MQNTNNDLTSGISDISSENLVTNPPASPAVNPVLDQFNLHQISETTESVTPISPTESAVIEKDATEVGQEKKSIKIDENFKADVDTSTSTNEDREEDSESYMDDTGDY